MSNVDQKNQAEILAYLTDITDQIRVGRNDFIKENLKEIQRDGDMRGELTAKQNSKIIKRFDIKKLSVFDQKLFAPISIQGYGNSALIAEAANAAFSLAYQQATKYRDEGDLAAGLEIYVGSIGDDSFKSMGQRLLTERDIPKRGIVSIVAKVAYGSSLEAYLYNTGQSGVVHFAATQIRRKYPELSVRYQYIDGRRLGLAGFTMPILQISDIGDKKGSITQPGRSRRGPAS